MVFNVQKFESTVRHSQVDRIPADLLLSATDRKKKNRVSPTHSLGLRQYRLVSLYYRAKYMYPFSTFAVQGCYLCYEDFCFSHEFASSLLHD